ncbi:MAG TPA: EamA family transporter [Solirubrobacterales bacterium]|nr:EamA family transporter [Solirubrobacterales bacterium]
MVLASVLSVQSGAALATTLFDRVGPAGAVFLRTLFGALILLALGRGRLPRLRGERLRDVAVFGAALAAMNLSFYASIDRLPLGVAVTIEFVGPLGLAIFGSRRRRDVLWALLAAAGIVLLSDGFGDGGIDPLGAALALLAGCFWALYIVQGARVGRGVPGLGGLTGALVFSTLLVAPLGIAQGGSELLAPGVLLAGLAVGALSSAIPYGLELEALRRLPHAVFGVMMSLEPALAALVGFVALSQDLAAVEVVAIGLVVVASAGALRAAGAPAPRDA